MSKLSKTSITRLQTCHRDIQRLVLAVAAEEELLVVEGHRSQERQAELLKKGLSKTTNSKHLKLPSEAVDLMPLPLDWQDHPRVIAFAQRVLKKAEELNIKIRWGGDWNMNGKWTDEKFRDFVHFELIL